jgi:hypothetical protein
MDKTVLHAADRPGDTHDQSAKQISLARFTIPSRSGWSLERQNPAATPGDEECADISVMYQPYSNTPKIMAAKNRKTMAT